MNVLFPSFNGVDDTTCNLIWLVKRHVRNVGVLRDFSGNQTGSRGAGCDVGDDDARVGQFPPQRFAEQPEAGF